MTALTIQVTALARSVQTLTDDVGALKGEALRLTTGRKDLPTSVASSVAPMS